MAKVKGMVNVQGRMKQINQFIPINFASWKSDHALLIHKPFIIRPWNFEVKVTVELMENVSVNSIAILMIIVAQTNSKYGMKSCIGKFF